MRGTIEIGRGPRQVESAVLGAVEATLLPGGRPTLDARLRVVVPSRSLAQHVSAALVRELGRPLLGLRVQTLSSLARELVESSPERPRPVGRAFPFLVREATRLEPDLRDSLEAADPAQRSVVAVVSDLLDAGLDTPQVHDLELAFRNERSRALARVAGAVRERMRELGLAREGDWFAAAAARLRRDPGSLSADALLIHGFADATGLAERLLAALVESGARAFLDRPPDPDDPTSEDPAAAFGDRLQEVLAAPATRLTAAAPEPTRLRLLCATTPALELRAVAERVEAALARGVAPERIGVTARVLEPYALDLRTQFERLGIPFSGCGAPGPRRPGIRPFYACLELLHRGREAPVDALIDALSATLAPRRLADLGTQLFARGASRLGDVAALELADDDTRPSRRLTRAREQAIRVLALLADSPERASLEAQAGTLRDLWSRALELGDTSRAGALLEEVIEITRAGFPDELRLDRAGFVELLAEVAGEVDRLPIGGAGGGVQVLEVTEARARSFEELFVLGLNRDVFPRVIEPDPLLPDGERQAGRAVLPALPVKGLGHQEERYLYAQLVASSPAVTASFSKHDRNARARKPSSLISRHLLADPERPVETVTEAAPRTALELAIDGGLEHGRAGFAARLELWLGSWGVSERGRLGSARAALLEVLDPPFDAPSHASPFFGAIGPLAELDPHRPEPSVTALERLSVCGWQTLLSRVLRLTPPLDPLELLPALDPRRIGNAVHRALEKIVAAGGAPVKGTLEAVATRPAVEIAWPGPTALREAVLEAADEILRADGVALPELSEALAARVEPYLERARLELFPGGTLHALASEVEGSVAFDDDLALRFRADLAHREAGTTVLTDYKTGRLPREKLEQRVARGDDLQGAAYHAALAALGVHPGAGQYLYVAPDVDPAASRRSVDDGSAELHAGFRTTAHTLLEAWGAGVFSPRLQDKNGEEPRACGYCELADACLRGDWAAGHRMRDWLERAADDPAPEAARALWRLRE